MARRLKSKRIRQSGGNLTEYGMLAALILLVSLVCIPALGVSARETFKCAAAQGDEDKLVALYVQAEHEEALRYGAYDCTRPAGAGGNGEEEEGGPLE